jgi:Flp pilus assembly protein CpaB
MSNTSFTGKVSGRMSSRGWAIALGIGAVVLAAILLVVYLDRYRSRVAGENAPTPVLVAKQLIPSGTPGTLVASQSMYAPTTLPQKEVEVGAISDPSYLSGRAAAADIFPGQQLTATDFAASDTASVDSQITGTQRGISIAIDGVHGSSSQVMPGDSVDVYISLGARASGGNLVKLFRPNVKVLTTPSVPGPAGGSNLVLRIDTKDAATWAYAADNAQFYFVLRPVVGAKQTKKSQATVASLLR